MKKTAHNRQENKKARQIRQHVCINRKQMISWLQGQRLDNWEQAVKRGIVIACSGVGYEVQLLPRYLALICKDKELTLWVHQVKREDGESLYGFQTKAERDLFRKMIGVSGIGPQIGMALLEEIQVELLVSSIIQGDIDKLSKAQGVGKKTAERLVIELRNKLSEFDAAIDVITKQQDQASDEHRLTSSMISELQEALKSLGYEQDEIKAVIHAIENDYNSNTTSKSLDLSKHHMDFEYLLKASLLWLSNDSK